MYETIYVVCLLGVINKLAMMSIIFENNVDTCKSPACAVSISDTENNIIQLKKNLKGLVVRQTGVQIWAQVLAFSMIQEIKQW